MKVIPYLHDYISELPAAVQDDIKRHSTLRKLAKGEPAYCKGGVPNEVFRIREGAIKLCNYSLNGSEIIAGELRPGDCFGEMGVMDGLPRVSEAIASKDTCLSVISKQNFQLLCDKHPQLYRALNRMLCRRVRFLYSLNEESVGLKLHVRLARVIHRLAYSHGCRDEHNGMYIEISHEEVSNMLGASRQSVSKELKSLEREGDIALRYGKIYIHDLNLLGQKYETAIGMEQITSVYDDGPLFSS